MIHLTQTAPSPIYLEELDKLLPPEVIDDCCDAVTLHEIPSGVKAIADFLAHVNAEPKGGRDHVYSPESLKVSDSLAPWQYGYRQARQLRSEFGIGGPIGDDLDPVLRETLGSFEVHAFEAPDGIDTIVAPNRARVPWFGIPNRVIRPQSWRFVLCRALSDYLAMSGPSLVTRAQTEHQQRNRAFAAEFLAPAESSRERLAADRVSDEELEDLAQHFGVSGFVIRHQIENHRLARILSQDTPRQHAPDPAPILPSRPKRRQFSFDEAEA